MQRTAVGLFVLVAASVAGMGCNLEPGVPGQPSYEADVKPILEARCIRCHGFPAIGNATPGFRFDLYECPTPDAGDATCTFAAKDLAPRMVIRARGENVSPMPPPPAAKLSPYQIDTIDKWSKQNPPSP